MDNFGPGGPLSYKVHPWSNTP